MSRLKPAVIVLAVAHILWLSAGAWLPDLARGIWLEGEGGASLAVAFRCLIAPIVVLGLVVSWLVPGLLAVRLANPRRSFAEWILLAAPASALMHVAIASGAKLAFPTPVDPWAPKSMQILVELGLLLGPPALGRLRASAARAGAVAVEDPSVSMLRGPDRLAAFAAAGLCIVATALFCEQIFVRELTSDGIESLDMGASLAWHHLPRTPTGSGLVGLGVGMIAQAFPAYWFTTVVGATEAAPRLGLILFLPVMMMGVVALAERGLSRRISVIGLAAAGAALLAGAAMLGQNASFDPYYADLSSPAALDAMTVAMMLGVVYAVVAGSFGGLLMCASLAHFCRPSGLLLLLLLGATALVLDRGARTRRMLRVLGAAAFCLLLTFLYEKVYVPRVIEGGALGLESGSMLRRLRYLAFTDWQRVVIVLFASGLFPWLEVLRLRRQDRDSLLVTLPVLGLLAVFLFPASYAPHHFAPVFVLAQIPFWRAVLASQPGSRATVRSGAAVVLALVALVVLLPPRRAPQPFREIAKAISIEVPVPGPLARDLLSASAPLEHLVKLPWTDADPAKDLVGSPLVLAWYAQRLGGGESALLRVVPASAPRPAGYELLAESKGVALMTRDRGRAETLARTGHPTDFARTLFAVPRDRLFQSRMVKAHLYDLDLKSLLGR